MWRHRGGGAQPQATSHKATSLWRHKLLPTTQPRLHAISRYRFQSFWCMQSLGTGSRLHGISRMMVSLESSQPERNRYRKLVRKFSFPSFPISGSRSTPPLRFEREEPLCLGARVENLNVARQGILGRPTPAMARGRRRQDYRDGETTGSCSLDA